MYTFTKERGVENLYPKIEGWREYKENYLSCVGNGDYQYYNRLFFILKEYYGATFLKKEIKDLELFVDGFETRNGKSYIFVFSFLRNEQDKKTKIQYIGYETKY